MVSEKRINELEVKLLNTLELLKEAIRLSSSFDNRTTDYLVEKIEELQR